MAIKIGDFVTCYSAGYWQLIDIKPHIAHEDYSSPYISYKKGDVLGQHAILKKAFTPKMKPRIEFDVNDFAYLKPVTGEIIDMINEYFENDPKYKEKFDKAPVKIRPSITNVWLDIPDEDAEKLQEVLGTLPEKFTIDEIASVAEEYLRHATRPPARYIPNLLAYPWDLNEKFDMLYHGWELKKN
ncbi:MAG: hypothetical protein IKM61_01830 [Eubacteriaceae bacterium]|nr:hypothetical protein [Eubacteriaceae bacterium]